MNAELKISENPCTSVVPYGSKFIKYQLIRCDRKTMEIAVHPDGNVIVKAPMNAHSSLIQEKIQKKSRWILRQLNYFRQFTPKTTKRCYVNGETHLYLGKQYRLKLTKGAENTVRLSRGFFHITCRDAPNPETAKKLLHGWYAEKASIQFLESMDRCWPAFKRFASVRPALSIKLMRRRWGSLSDKGTMTLNTNLIRAPKECIDYVVTHELCHLKYRDHGPDFYKLLDSVIPGWKKIKHKLELSMV